MKTVFFCNPHSVIVQGIYKDIYESKDITWCNFDITKVGNDVFSKVLFFGSKGKFLPFFIKDRIYKKTLQYDFLNSKSDDFLFIFTGQYVLLLEGEFITFVNYLKKKFKNSKFAFVLSDIVSRFRPGYIEEIKDIFDIVLTFDKADAEKYGFIYKGATYSKTKEIKLDPNEEPEISDVFYVGGDAGRFETTIGVFKTLSDAGKRCVFYIAGILKENQGKLNEFLKNCKKTDKENVFIYKNSILHVNELLTYGKVLRHIAQTKCIVEVILPGQYSHTFRAAESVVYNKKFITNCKSIKDMPYYREENIFVFDKPEDIDAKFLDIPGVPVDYDFSPLKMIELIKEKLY